MYFILITIATFSVLAFLAKAKTISNFGAITICTVCLEASFVAYTFLYGILGAVSSVLLICLATGYFIKARVETIEDI